MSPFSRTATRYVGRLSNQLRRKLDALSAGKLFTGAQGRILQFLLTQPAPVFQKDIEAEYSMRPSSATELLRQMEKNGLILRRPAPYDNRLKEITLTPKARAYREQVSAGLAGLEAALTRGISPQELDTFFTVMEKMMDNIGGEG